MLDSHLSLASFESAFTLPLWSFLLLKKLGQQGSMNVVKQQHQQCLLASYILGPAEAVVSLTLSFETFCWSRTACCCCSC